MNPRYVARMNAFLNRYADQMEAAGAVEKAVAVRMLTTPTVLFGALRA